jgi:hypothetical protein
VGVLSRALSILAFIGTLRPPRIPSSEVMTRLQVASRMRSFSESGEKPPNTMECTAPMRVQASMATAVSGIIGI